MPGKKIHTRTVDSPSLRRAFTLVEMLVVLSIIALMLLVTLPAFKGLNSGKSRQGAVTSLMGVLDHARMMAVSDGLATYVVFARQTKTGNQVNPALWGRAYAIFQDADNVSFNVVQRTPWLYLPNSVAFKMDAMSVGNSGVTTASVTNQNLVAPGADSTNIDPLFPVSASALPANTQSPISVQLPYWKFDSTGAVDEKSLDEQAPANSTVADQQRNNYLRVLLFSGYVNAQGQEISTQNNGSSAGNSSAPLLEEIDVNAVTGRARYVVDNLNNLATPTPSPGT